METTYPRSQVASVTTARDWNVGFLLLAVVFGTLVGLGFGLKDQLLRRGLGQDESYLVLASTLYGLDPTPATAASVRQNLVALDFPSPSLTVLKLADRFSQSRDKDRVRDAESLRLLGEALNTAIAPAALASVVPTAAAVSQPVDLVVSAPSVPTATALPQASPVSTPPAARAAGSADQSPSPTAAAIATAPPAPVASPPPAPTAKPTSAAESGSATATVRSNDGRTLVLRRDASSKSTKIVSMPDGAKVQIIRQVTGEAVEGQDARWYLVKYKDVTGYAYAKYIAPAN